MADNEIVKTVLIDKTSGNKVFLPYVIREVPITKKMRIPLYEAGKLKSDEQLQNLGLIVKHYTQEELDEQTFTNYYIQNPTLAQRVRQYASLLSQYNLGVDATSDQISEAIMVDGNLTQAQKMTLGASLITLIHDIELNYSEVGQDGFNAWADLPKLIKYLPEESSDSSEQNIIE